MASVPDIDNSSIDAWLLSLEPREELTMRFAIRGRFQEMRAAPAFERRLGELLEAQHLPPAELEKILNEANRLEATIDRILEKRVQPVLQTGMPSDQ